MVDPLKQYLTVQELLDIKEELMKMYNDTTKDGEVALDSAMLAAQVTLVDRLILKAKLNM